MKRPSDVAFAVRMEIGRTITEEEAEEALAGLQRLESSGNRWGIEETTTMREASKTDPSLCVRRRVFGPAGGPDEIVLTDEGAERAFSVGAQIKRGLPAKALELLWSIGGEGQYSERHGSKMTPTDLGRIDQIAWGYLRSLGYVESVPPDGIRLTDAGVSAVEWGHREQENLLQRCRRDFAGSTLLEEAPRPDFKKQASTDLARSQREEARAEIAQARQDAADARAACTAARRKAIDVCALAKTLRTKRDALVALAHEYRLIRRAELARLRKGPGVSRAVHRSESDDEVRQNIPPELLPTFEVVKRSIKAHDRKSRTEAFLEWVEAHPSEIVYVEPSDEDYERSYAQRRVGEDAAWSAYVREMRRGR